MGTYVPMAFERMVLWLQDQMTKFEAY